SWLHKALSQLFFPASVSVEQGLYFWGGVGRGKTYLMDNFYDCLPFSDKMRVHFHRFMRRIHSELRQLKGQVNPLEKVADRLADETRIICFDEFFVSDITDAMILSLLLQALFERGVCLVATSNIRPDQLYYNGLQRKRFLPAIALLKQHCEVVNVDGGTDYRLRALERMELFYYPLGDLANAALDATFRRLVHLECEVKSAVALKVEGRVIHTIKLAEDIVWFDFRAICEGPRSQNDYIEIAREFQAVLISAIPALGAHNEDAVRRFINLVDEFYDRNVKLVLSAAEPLDKLYKSGGLTFEFQRTESRLLEMQSHNYLARAHRP
ncbi:MAG: cell division protein ZapE, partial [Porticoccaceae bacterium]|nr:cell division protein ZapE [Porticoccaceae bacterium]